MKNYFLIALYLLLISCSQNFSLLFNDIIKSSLLVEKSDRKVLYSIDLHGSSGNLYYDKMYSEGKVHNDFLLKKALSEKITGFYIPNIVGSLSEGDIAIKLLQDINFKGSDQRWTEIFVHKDILKQYLKNGASIWWEWINEKKENRNWIIERIKEYTIQN